MKTRTISGLLVALTQLGTVCFANPIQARGKKPSGPKCQNFPKSVAGTMVARDLIPSTDFLYPRQDTSSSSELDPTFPTTGSTTDPFTSDPSPTDPDDPTASPLPGTSPTDPNPPKPAFPIIWCTEKTETYVNILSTSSMTFGVGAASIQTSPFTNYTTTVLAYVLNQIKTNGDKVITMSPPAVIDQPLDPNEAYTSPFQLQVFNGPNNQLTWGVLGAAIQGLMTYEKSLSPDNIQAGPVNFQIFDGPNQVGLGTM